MSLLKRSLLVGPAHLALVLICCLTIYVSGVSCQRGSDDQEEKDIEVTYNISRDAVLACTVKNLGGRRIIWRRISDPYPISVGGAKFIPSNKYRVMSRGETCTLFIRKLTPADAGEYLCEASGGAGPREPVLLNIKAGANRPYFERTERKIVAKTGDTVLLPCHVENMNDRMVLWKNDRNEVLSLRKKELLGDRRYRVIHDTRTEWSMQIKRLRESDFGFYTCVVNTDPVITRTVELENSEPARFAPVLMEDTSFRRRQEAKLGETVTLTCNFNAHPPAEVTWYKKRKENGKMKKISLGKGNTYVIRSVSASESGDYLCIGNNGMGKPSRGKTRLIVKVPTTTRAPITTTTQFVPTGPASPRLYHVNRRVGQRRGRGAVIECIGVGSPRPELEWKRHGQKLRKNYKYDIVPSIDGVYRSMSRLELRGLSSRDFGDYQCVGHNKLGLVSISFDLYKIE